MPMKPDVPEDALAMPSLEVKSRKSATVEARLQVVGKRQIRFPELRDYLTRWHKGKTHRTGVQMAWNVLSLHDRSSMYSIHEETLDENTEVGALLDDFERRMEMFASGAEDFLSKSFVVVCHFLHEDTGQTGKEEWYGSLSLPPENPQFGQQSVARGGTLSQKSEAKTWTGLALDDKNRMFELCMQKDEVVTRAMLSMIEKQQAHIMRLEDRHFQSMEEREKMFDRSAEREALAYKAKMQTEMMKGVYEQVGGVVKQAVPSLALAAKDWMNAKAFGPSRAPTSREADALDLLRDAVTGMKRGLASQGLTKEQQEAALEEIIGGFNLSPEKEERLKRMVLDFELEGNVEKGGPGGLGLVLKKE